jgi:hypothetical protein
LADAAKRLEVAGKLATRIRAPVLAMARTTLRPMKPDPP